MVCRRGEMCTDGLGSLAFADVYFCADLRLVGAIRANSPMNRVMGPVARTRPATAEVLSVRTSTERSRHKASLSTRRRMEVEVICLLADSPPLVMERSGTIRDIVDRPTIGAKPRAEARLPVTTTSKVRLVRYAL